MEDTMSDGAKQVILGATGGYHELKEINRTRRETLNNFGLIRFLLRVLSLWRPSTAGVFERYIYPVIISLLLFFPGLIRNVIQAIVKGSWLSIPSMYVVHEIGIWLGHILANYYFRSGDLENLAPSRRLPWVEKPLKRKMKFLNAFVVISFVFFSLMLSTIYVVWFWKWNKGSQRFTSDLPYIHGPLDHVIYALVLITLIYDLGIGLALSWTMGLLYVCYSSRLKALKKVFLKWSDSTNNAIYLFQKVYSRPVKSSWKRIWGWFLVHNIIAIAIPLYGYELARVMSGDQCHSKYLPQFISYLIFVLTIWLVPIIFAEQIKRSEKIFQEKVNNFSLGLLKEIPDCEIEILNIAMISTSFGQPFTDSSLVETSGDTAVTYTFASRGKELKYFLQFLKKRAQGLVSHGYALQLNVSVVSLFVGIISFLIKLNGNTMGANERKTLSNCTLY